MTVPANDQFEDGLVTESSKGHLVARIRLSALGEEMARAIVNCRAAVAAFGAVCGLDDELDVERHDRRQEKDYRRVVAAEWEAFEQLLAARPVCWRDVWAREYYLQELEQHGINQFSEQYMPIYAGSFREFFAKETRPAAQALKPLKRAMAA